MKKVKIVARYQNHKIFVIWRENGKAKVANTGVKETKGRLDYVV